MPRFGKTISDAPEASHVSDPFENTPTTEEDTMTIAPDTDAPAPDAPAPDAPATPEVLNGTTDADKAKRGRPKLADLPALDLDSLGDDSDVPEDEWDTASLEDTARQGLPRSEAQVKIDNAVAAVHAAWVERGKPTLALAPRKRYTVKPEFEATTRAMLVRAGAHHRVRVIQSTLHNGQGMAVITFTAIDRPPKPEKVSDTPAEATASTE